MVPTHGETMNKVLKNYDAIDLGVLPKLKKSGQILRQSNYDDGLDSKDSNQLV